MVKKFDEYMTESLVNHINEFKTVTAEEEFIDIINSFKEKDIVINDKVLLFKAKSDDFKGELKEVISKDTGRTVLIYRPSISLGSKLNSFN